MSFKINCLPVCDSYLCCCCSCSLRTATLLFGWLTLVGCLIQMICYSIYLVKFEDIGRFFWFDSRELCIGLISEAAVLASCCLLLLCGVYKASPGFFIPYLIVTMLGIFTLTVITIIIGFSKLFKIFFIGLIIILSGFAVVAYVSYVWLVVYSYYRALIEKCRRSRVQQVDFSAQRNATEEETLN